MLSAHYVFTGSSIAIAVACGLLFGLLIGAVFLICFRNFRKRKTSRWVSSFNMAFPQMSFYRWLSRQKDLVKNSSCAPNFDIMFGLLLSQISNKF